MLPDDRYDSTVAGLAALIIVLAALVALWPLFR